MLKTLEPDGIFRSMLLYLILTLSSHWYENGDEASPSIILAGRALLVKMLISLEPVMHLVQILNTFIYFFILFFLYFLSLFCLLLFSFLFVLFIYLFLLLYFFCFSLAFFFLFFF